MEVLTLGLQFFEVDTWRF